MLEFTCLKDFNTAPTDPTPRPGDEILPDIKIPPPIQYERKLWIEEQNPPESEIRAFTIAAKAGVYFYRRNFKEAERIAWTALPINPQSMDAWRLLAITITQNCGTDGDSVVVAHREVLDYFRPIFIQQYEDFNGDPPIYVVRPFTRLLVSLGAASRDCEQYDTAVFAFEEAMRIDKQDHMRVYEPLLFMYIKMARKNKLDPESYPIRSFEHANNLIKERKLSEDLMVVRWVRMTEAYLNDGDWQTLVKAEWKRCKYLFQILFEDIPGVWPKPGVDDDEQAAFRLSQPARRCIKDWIEFIIECQALVATPKPTWAEDIRSEAPLLSKDLTRDTRSRMATMGQMYLEKGRQALTNHKYHEAQTFFTMCKRYYLEALLPSHRFYTNAPFACVSNRATACQAEDLWNLCRIDTRWTLLMKPDHTRSYYRLPKMMEVYNCPQLKEIFSQIVDDIKENPEKSAPEWRAIANKVIGLLSVKAIILSILGQLTEEIQENLILIGIDNFYINASIEPDIIPPCPWNNEDELELDLLS